MAFNLGRLVSFHTFFHSEIPVLYMLKGELTTMLASLLSNFMELLLIQETCPMHIDVNYKEHYVPLNQVYVGLRATDTIKGIADDVGRDHPDIQLFYTHCRNFLIETVKQILSRFDDVDKFNFLSFITPASAYVLSPSSLSHVYRKCHI